MATLLLGAGWRAVCCIAAARGGGGGVSGGGSLSAIAAALQQTRGCHNHTAAGPIFEESVELAGRTVVFETGRLARLANGACVVRCGGTAVLATAVVDASAPPPSGGGDSGAALQVEYRERASAWGRIPARADRRDPGSGTEREVLAGRAVDRALRPLLPPGFRYPTQVWVSVLSADGGVEPEVLAINAASAALALSDVPWAGPVGAVRVAHFGSSDANPFMLNPSMAALAAAPTPHLALTYAGTASRLAVMVEAGGNGAPEAVVEAALHEAVAAAALLVAPQLRLAARAGRRKQRRPLSGAAPELGAAVAALASGPLAELFGGAARAGLDKAARGAALARVQRDVLRALRDQGLLPQAAGGAAGTQAQQQQHSEADALCALDALASAAMRHELLLGGGRRADGRAADELRPLLADAAPLPHGGVHGAALFSRGETQSLAIAAVAAEREASSADAVAPPPGAPRAGNNGAPAAPASVPPPRTLHLHYSFPPFSVNEIGRMSAPNRRELGHGGLAERALAPLMPSPEDFPFVARIVAETLGSSGSSSMAAVCSGALALRAAGVPTAELAAGISVGLAVERPPQLALPHDLAAAAHGAAYGYGGADDAAASETSEEDGAAVADSASLYGRHVYLTDIQGMEDHLGDMDFKIAGTRRGVTAIQLDTKLPGVPLQILAGALAPAARARGALLDALEQALAAAAAAAPEAERPHVEAVVISKELVPRLVGLQGCNVLEIEAATGGRLSVSDTGEVVIYAPSRRAWRHAADAVLEVEGRSIAAGEQYDVRVVKVVDYGAYVELPNGMPCLLHIGELSHKKVRDIHGLVREGETLRVLCKGRDAKGLIVLSRKALMEKPPEKADNGGGGGGEGGGGGGGGKKKHKQQPHHHAGEKHADGAAHPQQQHPDAEGQPDKEEAK